MNNQSENEWAAFQYLAEELSPAEQLEFEQELETSESACEELLKSVRITQSLVVALCEEEPSTLRRTQGRKQTSRQTAWLRSCVCLILVAGVTFGLGYSFGWWDSNRAAENQLADNTRKDIVHPELTRANELIAIWADIESASADDTAVDDVLFEVNEEDESIDEEERDDDSFDWLYSVVSE